MGQLVSPKVYYIGCTEVDEAGLFQYLHDTDQQDFIDTYREALAAGLSGGEALCSFYAKLCYKSLVVGKNANITRTRDIIDNIAGCHNTGHGSVFEHCQLNFVVRNCSRILTHEQVRHRAGWAYSQTSGRYCRLDSIDLVWDPVLDPVKDMWLEHLANAERLVYLTECRLGLRKPNPKNPDRGPAESVVPDDDLMWVPDESFSFDKRKKITSAIRRIAPNGQANEIGMSVNIRALRHYVQLRTGRHAEREIRDVASQIYHLVAEKFPTIFADAHLETIDGFVEVSGLRTQPYEIVPGDPKALAFWSSDALATELDRRTAHSV